jgi:hypothetical protein
MTIIRKLLFATAFCMVPAVSMAAAAGAGSSGAAGGAGVGAATSGGVSAGERSAEAQARRRPEWGVSPTGNPMPLSTPNGGTVGATPGGVTLVPGTVVTPGVSGSSITGTVPLAGTVGSQASET